MGNNGDFLFFDLSAHYNGSRNQVPLLTGYVIRYGSQGSNLAGVQGPADPTFIVGSQDVQLCGPDRPPDQTYRSTDNYAH